MPIDTAIIKEASDLDACVHEHAKAYVHSRPLATSNTSIILPDKRKYSFQVIYDIKDLLLIGSITESPVLLTGGTDTGKTTLAKLVMNALFGLEEKGWHKLDMDTDFGRDSVADINSDFFHEGGKTLKDFYSAQPWLSLPGFIADELNRAHAKQSAKALHIIGEEKEITLPDGRRVKIGLPLGDGSTYQFQIVTINEGKEYAGVFDIDKALRRRTTIEIPMDNFPLTPFDRLVLQKNGDGTIRNDNDTSNLDTVLELRKASRDIPLHPITEMFVAYLESFEYCKHSLTQEKGSVESRQGSIRHICTQPMKIGSTQIDEGVGCEYLVTFKNELCPYTRGLTAGVSKNLRNVAKGFALLRAVKFAELLAGYVNGVYEVPLSFKIDQSEILESSLQEYAGTDLKGISLAKRALETYAANFEVLREDVEAALGFVAYSKMGISPPWVAKHYQGNTFAALKALSDEAGYKFAEGLAAPACEHIQEILQGKGTAGQVEQMKTYLKAENPWLLRVITPYLQAQQNNDVRERMDDLFTV